MMSSSSEPSAKLEVFLIRPWTSRKTSAIENSPYVRGYSLPTPPDSGRGQVVESFQYGFDEAPLCAHDDESKPIHERFFRGPNTWPDSATLPGFKPMLEELNSAYHRLTLQLGELIVESLGEDPAEFRQYFNLDEPYLFASLNHNFSLDAIVADKQDFIRDEYKKPMSPVTGAHIDGPPFVALLINDRPGLQVVAGDGGWMNAPVTCRTAAGDYSVPVMPGAVIVNTGGSLMHLSEGRLLRYGPPCEHHDDPQRRDAHIDAVLFAPQDGGGPCTVRQGRCCKQ